MKYQLTCEKVIYAFDKNNSPILSVASGDSIDIDTYDCFENQVHSADIPLEALEWDRVNPATGPIFIKGAEPGDILSVTIEEIEIGDQGVMAVGPGLGVLGDRIPGLEAKIIPIREGKAIFNNLELPLNPMVGVIGVAPAGDPVSCGTPGSHGGNMDNKLIAPGATVYFPVFVTGALFALGDFHAAMGDGEIGVSGIEVPGKARVTLKVIKSGKLTDPLVQNGDHFATIASAATLDEAVKKSVENMADLLYGKTNLSFSELTMLLSAVGQTQICQVVDPLMTARFVVPNWVLQKLEITLF